MRKLPPFKAISHALKSVATYRGVGLRLGFVWILILWTLGLARLFVTNGSSASESVQGNVLALASAAIGLAGFCSIAVGWHRFVLRDEAGLILRLDEPVWRYIGNTLLIMVIVLLPMLVLALAVERLPQIASLLLLPAGLIAGTIALRLSIKLPAVALGRKDFGLRDAVASSEGNFWPLMGVFLLNAAIVLGSLLGLALIVRAVAGLDPTFASFVGLTGGMIFQLFYTLFNASVFTSLYGFFVEQRDF